LPPLCVCTCMQGYIVRVNDVIMPKIHKKMSKNYDNLVQEVVKSINWNRIKYFHHVFGIKWQFEEKEGHIAERYPNIADLKEELRTLLKFAIAKDTPVLDYGNWLIMWTNEEAAERQGSEGARLEAIFSLEDSIAVDNQRDTIDIEILKKKLAEAVEKERYEDAAKYRDRLNALEKKD
jgi:excinuclease UvrABC helicase subunit UvrB